MKRLFSAGLAVQIACSPLAAGIAVADGPSEFRSIDGTGNNVTDTTYGSTGIRLLRKGLARYGDGVSIPGGNPSVSARAVSNAVGSQTGLIENDRNLSDFVWTWGQFVDHDLDLTNGAVPSEAFNIPVPTGDPYFDPLSTGTKTIGLSRSEYDPLSGTGSGNPRQQTNSITAFIDGSNIYGSDPVRAAALRTFVAGTLKTSTGNLLPFNTDHLPNAMSTASSFFLAGDVRANEQPSLIAMHTLFVREHNRTAAVLAQEHPEWTDEELYQQARRKVIALEQAVTYNEFIPALFGENALSAYVGYDPEVNPGINNEFSTAAYRFGHTMLSPTIMRLEENGDVIAQGSLSLLQAFFRPDRIVNEGGIDPIIRGIAAQNMQEVDTREIDDVRNFLFGPPGSGGFDLASLNIQRGRDHGLPGYNQMRRDYGLDPKTDFSEITSDTDIADALSDVYEGDIESVDAWIGGLAEDHIPGSSVGELFTTVILDQFARVRDGDRFWYENDMTPSEILEVNGTKLSDILKRNTDILAIQENVFFTAERVPVGPDIGVDGSAPAIVFSGSTLDVSVNLLNSGNGPSVQGTSLELILPAGVTPVTLPAGCSFTDAVECTPDELGENSGITLDFSFDFSPDLCGSDVTVAASISGNANDPVVANDSVQLETFIACPSPDDVDLNADISLTDSVERDSTFAVTLRSGNNGPGDEDGGFVSFNLPLGISINSVGDERCSASGQTVLCTGLSIAKDEEFSTNIELNVAEDAPCPSSVEFVAHAGSNAHVDYYEANNTSVTRELQIECQPENDLSLVLSGLQESPIGDVFHITATAENAGPASASAPEVRIPLVTGITFVSTESEGSCVQDGAIIVCSGSALSADESQDFDIAFTSLDALACGTEITLSGTVTSDEVEISSQDNTSPNHTILLTCTGDTDDETPSVSSSGSHAGQGTNDDGTPNPGARRGSGTNEALIALALLCERNGMDTGMRFGGSFRVTGNNPQINRSVVASDTDLIIDGFNTMERSILCGMKSFMNQEDILQRKTPEFRAWLVGKLSETLHKTRDEIEAALQSETLCAR